MKIFKYGVIVSAMIVGLTSCRSHSDQPEAIGSKEISFSLGGEFAQISYEPLARAQSTTKYIGMNIYSKPAIGDGDGDEEYEPYAYGVFTDIESMKILLSPDYEYKFECTTLEEDQHKIAKIKNDDDAELKYPFCVGKEETSYKLSNLNKFVLSSNENLSKIYRGMSTIATEVDNDGFATKIKDEKYHPSQMRYYGIREGFKVSSSNLKASIPLKSASFGLKIVAEEIPDGEITLNLADEDTSLDVSAFSLSPTNTEMTVKYSFEDMKACGNSTDAKPVKSFDIIFTWKREGSLKTAKKEIEVQRNTLTVITLNVDKGDKNIVLEISEEEKLNQTDIPYDVTIK